MAFGDDILDAVIGGIPELTCEIKLADNTHINGVSAGLEIVRDYDDRGIAAGITGNVRYKATEETGAAASVGDRISVKLYGQTDWIYARVAGRMEFSGSVRLELEGTNER